SKAGDGPLRHLAGEPPSPTKSSLDPPFKETLSKVCRDAGTNYRRQRCFNAVELSTQPSSYSFESRQPQVGKPRSPPALCCGGTKSGSPRTSDKPHQETEKEVGRWHNRVFGRKRRYIHLRTTTGQSYPIL